MSRLLEAEEPGRGKPMSGGNLRELPKIISALPWALFLGSVVLLLPHALFGQHSPPTSAEVAAFAERVRVERTMGEEVPVPDVIFNTLMADAPSDYPPCNPKDRNDLDAHEVSLGSGGARILAIQGRGLCFCSPTGNCQLWIYRVKDGAYRELLGIGTVQLFGFVKSSAHGHPDLVAWSHGSATDYGVRLFRFNGYRYRNSGEWEEQYEYLDDAGQVVDVKKPRIIPHFSSEEQIPK
ncbi:MAG: hypothetical protein WA434_00975 [Candidatus Acidiferrales bacterium]